MACGTPVVASPIPGNDEVVRDRRAGLIAEARTPEAIAAAVLDLAGAQPARSETASYAAGFGWEATSQGQLDLFRRVVEGRR
ncbi:MAG: glycosyltransferase [Rhodospirillales bacterium]